MVKTNNNKNKIFYGILRFSNKKIYKGEYYSNKNKLKQKNFIFHGEGFLNLNGHKISANWENGKILYYI